MRLVAYLLVLVAAGIIVIVVEPVLLLVTGLAYAERHPGTVVDDDPGIDVDGAS